MKNNCFKSMEYARRGSAEKNNNFKSLYRLKIDIIIYKNMKEQ